MLVKIFKSNPKSYHIGCGSRQFYSLKVTLEIFTHRNSTGILKIIAKGQQVLLYMNGYIDMSCLKNGLKTQFWLKVLFFLPDTLKVTRSTISTLPLKVMTSIPVRGLKSVKHLSHFQKIAIHAKTPLPLCNVQQYKDCWDSVGLKSLGWQPGT